MTPEQIVNLFTYHAPHGDQAERYERINKAAQAFALEVISCVPADSTERTLAIRDIQRARMMANAAIAIHED